MKDYYTLKEIILGLRKEQLRIAKRVKLLERKISIYGEKRYEGSNFDFRLINNNVYLVYSLHEQYSFLENILNIFTLNIKKAMLGKSYDESLRKLGNGDYKIGGLGGVIATVLPNEQEKFNQLINDVLNDELIKHFFLNISVSDKNYLLLAPLKTDYAGLIEKNSNILFYDAKTDTINFMQLSGRKRNYIDTIKELMELKFPKKTFSEYLQNIIECNDERKKDIIFLDDKIPTKNTQFYLNDERDNFVLVRK